MKRAGILVLAGIALLTPLTPVISQAQVAGSTVVGVAVAELRDVAIGWSAKRQVLNQPVFNDKDERIGKIEAQFTEKVKGLALPQRGHWLP